MDLASTASRTRLSRGVAVALVALSLLLLPTRGESGAAVAEAAAGAPRALFFGDSLMGGTGAVPKRPVMARVAARRLGWSVTVDAYGGTGFTTAGPAARSGAAPYLDRMRRSRVLDTPYDVVLLEGGTNDAWRPVPADVLRARVLQVLELLERRQPQAQVVLMGAYDPPGRSDPRRADVDRVLAAVAAERGLVFFSPRTGRWAAGVAASRFLSPDRLHPSDVGYGVMGERLARELRAAVPQAAARPVA